MNGFKDKYLRIQTHIKTQICNTSEYIPCDIQFGFKDKYIRIQTDSQTCNSRGCIPCDIHLKQS